MSAQLAHAQRREPVDFVGIALIAHIAFKGNLVLYFNGRLPVAGTTRPPAVSLAQFGPHCVGRRPPGTRPPAARHSAARHSAARHHSAAGQGPPARARRHGAAQHRGRGGRALRGALASGGYTTKIFLYNKLPT